ncbi:MAG: hypothetical protein LH461_00225, partial [Spirochaetaceae bacterium]|nr:hypothetical protein [Spirochaetaceae bacterium]
FDPDRASRRVWLFAIARNVVVDHSRRVKARPWLRDLAEPTDVEAVATYVTTVRDADGRDRPAGEFIGVADVEIRCHMNASVLRADATGFSVWDSDGMLVLNAEM